MDYRAAALRAGLPVLTSNHERAEHVEAVVKVVVLGIYIYAHEVGVLTGIRVGQRAVALARDIRERVNGVSLELAVAPRPVYQLVNARAQRPGGSELSRKRLPAGRGHELPTIWGVGLASLPELFESGKVAHGGYATRAQGALLLRGEVGQEGEVVVLRAPPHAELVVEAAVALVRQMVRDFHEGRGTDALSGGVRGGHEVADGAEVRGFVRHDLEQGVTGAEVRFSLPRLFLALGHVFEAEVLPGLFRAAAVEDSDEYLVAGNGVLGEESGEHLVVERNLQPVFYLRGRGGFHIRDEHAQASLAVALQAEDVRIATHLPALYLNLEPCLEEHEHIAGGEVAREGSDTVVVRGALPGALAAGEEVDAVVPRRDRLLYLLLE